ncbi:subunits of heterodimeric actin filament capping protein Capz [Yamadazyma tenuis ATCC 10573]|uniref:F-actin-capping protein subunit alpha n=1 Tax=Candida tenuis (strain ATCC 10573 / BCRC 21748 / CBS 615 / JCM 9827 / NBRC 10315 / NRRL Y-1498 / VKM Y-70) TaxID=590646 RepID=G3B077_CANTC|nr:subunits of heterodimeric actin filament capping protein Capz [Yamadazyma tenuis ATCC 10573]EGV65339.1 subunits of heterodimeric actin filament capping protein Capz [Yamadazyma tenuis ATCC 10573]
MSSSVNLESLVSSLVKSVPPGELKGAKDDLSTILSDDNRLINSSIEQYINETGAVVSGAYVASKYNKHSGSSKYIDFVGRQLFNVDIDTQKAIDLEDYSPTEEYPSYFDDLVEQLEQYGEDHYPSTYAYTIVPKGDEVFVIIIGQRLNNDNYYTGQWNSTYVIKNGTIKGDIKVDIHYFEDGNVRLNYDESTSGQISASAKNIINFINSSENKTTLKIVDNFNELNQRYFKNLRRLLPVTRSKIHWGNAIGNYRLGSDVVNKQ